MKKQEILEIIGGNLRQLLHEKNIAVNELARKVDISAGTISKIINGNTGVTITLLIKIAEGLEIDISQILKGIMHELPTLKGKAVKIDHDIVKVGILSINNRRITCITDNDNKIIGRSEIEKGLDLAESASLLLQLIQDSIQSAFPKSQKFKNFDLKKVSLNLVMQSYEFEETKNKFIQFMLRTFNRVNILADWQLTHLCNFEKIEGLSLIVDKGVSLSYKENKHIKKIGGWKFPVYDFGGENWLGAETIHHTIEAVEGFVPMTELARSVLAKFGGSINSITEFCFKGRKDPDVYCLFCEVLLNRFFQNDHDAIKILGKGSVYIRKLLERADQITKSDFKIAIQGSLKEVYGHLIPKDRMVPYKENEYKAEYLANMCPEILLENGIMLSV